MISLSILMNPAAGSPTTESRVIVVAVLGAAGYYWKSRRDGAKAAEVKPTTAAVERGELRVTVSSTGKVVSNLDVEIKCKGSGNAIRVPFDVSEAVKKGELVVTIAAWKCPIRVDADGLGKLRRALTVGKFRANWS